MVELYCILEANCSMAKSVKVLTIRVPEIEMLQLEAYCTNNGRTKTDVIREYIRRLKVEDKRLHKD
ncbi:MAG TPA: CopG family transcriptional regulator [Cyanobacteria bacterium UBA8803]|nr:CopG family transcriptional regulator [Cyanobacteria bacterium UBA9273]HBL58477.1 CopG family transcriptional regulator [Cyanobacteria bacterium UBA8803]